MRRHSIHLATLLVVCVGLCMGCLEKGEKDVTPPPPPELPPPTHPEPEEIAEEIKTGLQPLDNVASFEIGITPDLKQQLIGHLMTAKRNHSDTEWGRKALMYVAHELEDRLQAARDNMHTDLVLLLCDLIEVLEPDNTKLPRFREWAKIQLERPIVKIVGWFEFEQPRYGEDEIYALLEVYIPATGKKERPKVMEGEEFLGLKFHRIIGKKRGMVLEYLKTKDKFAVYGPGPRSAILNADPNM
ncbi:MAG: hypothetical protein R6V12_20345 [Candidatus Hydrogenedentota bacterium]